MNRRQFVSSTAAVAAFTATPQTARAAAGPPARMKLGCQSAPTNETHLKYLARYGVRNVCGYPSIADGRLYATVDELKAMTDLADKCGVSIDCATPPFLGAGSRSRSR